MKKKSMTDNYNPQGSGSNSTDNKKNGAVDRAFAPRYQAEYRKEAMEIERGQRKAMARSKGKATKKAKSKKNIGVVGGYKYLTRKRNVQ